RSRPAASVVADPTHPVYVGTDGRSEAVMIGWTVSGGQISAATLDWVQVDMTVASGLDVHHVEVSGQQVGSHVDLDVEGTTWSGTLTADRTTLTLGVPQPSGTHAPLVLNLATVGEY